ncbi:uncharacterized protein LOC123322383 [Coccinella septempunctata]|uniref:uncharacterized protein LOC123322383 n=1 Tax=Coccinella septempunctata TaxID=41139 RepID=UPI001D0839E3|nr:uncharacterized protein LOC123322383 [Coccinella septempunctata]
MTKIIVLLQLFTFQVLLQAHQYEINPIKSSSGLLYHNLGKAQISNEKYIILTYHNLTHFKYQVVQILGFYSNSINLCDIAMAEHLSNDCKNQLSYVKTKVTIIEEIYNIISHQINMPRKKRGLFNGVGTAIKWLTGNPDSEDAQFYSDAINQIINNEKQTDVLMQQQVSILSSTISNFNNSFYKMNENIGILNKNLKEFNQFSKDLNNIQHAYEIESQISNHLILLIEMTDELLFNLQNYVNDVSLIQHGIINYRILPPEALYRELLKISTNISLPIPLSIENVYYYYKIMNLKSFIKNSLLTIAFEIPISSSQDLDLYQLFSLPHPHSEDNSLFSYIEPSKPFLLISPMRTSYLLADKLENCIEYHPREWICNQMPTMKKIDSSCEVQLLMKIFNKIPDSCMKRNIIADAEIWHKTDVNEWLFSLSNPTRISIICGEESLKQEIIEKMGILKLNSHCKAFTDRTSLETSAVLASLNSSYEIPSSSIIQDDCCQKLKRNLTVHAIHMEPIKLTSVNLHELKYAQHKLAEFDEQLQQQLNRPFIIQHSSWVTTALSITCGTILLIVLYNFMKWCGCFKNSPKNLLLYQRA